MALPCRRCRGEEGIFLVMWTLLLVAIFTMVAIVIDLGALRADRRKERSAADAAAAAGANDLAVNASTACTTALTYAIRNLGFDDSGRSCGSVRACDPLRPEETVLTDNAGGYTISIIHPVLNGSPLMKAEAVGGDITQTANATPDGGECERIGVEISYTRQSIFGKVAGSNSNSTKVHSVARFVSSEGPGAEKPALVALEQTENCTVDSGPGTIHAIATGTQPALIYADSDGTGANCGGSGGDHVFEGRNSGNIWADPSPTGAPGEFGYFAPTEADAFDTQPNYDQNGSLPPIPARRVRLPGRITRRPLDKIYHCGSVVPPLPTVPGCTTGSGGTDLIDDVSTRYGNSSTIPAGFTAFPGPTVGGTCTSPPLLFPAGINWYINCSLFQLSSEVTFQNRDIVFAGNLELKGGGKLTINSLNASDTIVVIRGTGGVTTASGGWTLDFRRTFLFMDNLTCPASPVTCGTLAIRVGDPSAWTPPTSGLAKNLIYWSETTQDHSVQGNPNFIWSGIFAAPRSRFVAAGFATVDAQNVQLWVRKAAVINNSATLLLRADPNKSISTSRAGSALIR